MLTEKEKTILQYLLKKYFDDESMYNVQNKRLLLKDMIVMPLILELNELHPIDTIYSVFANSTLYRQGYRVIIKFSF